MLRQHPLPVVAAGQLIPDPGWHEPVLPVNGSEALIPPRQQDAEIDPLGRTFMTDPNAVVASVKLRPHDEMTDRTRQAQTQIGMLPLLDHPR